MVPDGRDEIIENGKIAVMGTLIARELPNPFHRIQVRAVRGQEIQLDDMSVLVQPRIQMPRMVPPRVVHNDNHLVILAAVMHELFQEGLKGHRVKGVGASRNKAAVVKTHGTEQRHALARRGVQQDWIRILRRYPHRAS